MNHKECHDLFVDALYKELSPERKHEFDAHRKECSACADEFASLQGTAHVMSRKERVEPSAERWGQLWNDLVGQLGHDRVREERRSVWEGLLDSLRYRPVLGYAGAAVALVILGVFLGRTYFAQPGFDAERLSQQMSAAEKTILNDRALNYLEKSRVLLLGIVNTGTVTPSSLDINKQQEISRALVREAATLKGELTDADQQRMKKLVGDLEMILIQIANLEAEKDFPGLDMVKSGVDRKGILLKINLEQMRLQELERQQGEADKQSSQVSS